MYKGKPLIVGERPWHRHPVFPWGWYSVKDGDIKPQEGAVYFADGWDEPGVKNHWEIRFHDGFWQSVRLRY